jgi:phosphatidate phosphatase LPIN
MMTVDENYRCTFDGGKLRPRTEWARALGQVLVAGRNVVRYQLSGNRALFDIHACIYLWEHTDRIVVCDIDGTVTRSDFLGYSAHLMGYEYTHDGVTDVLNYLHEAGYKILFLTARPITVADRTRDLLQTVGSTARDDKSQSFARFLGLHTSDTVLALPPGALITTAERWIPAIALSLTPDGPQKFKTSVLHEIKDLFGSNNACFAGGFGNRATDSGAYRATGMRCNLIYASCSYAKPLLLTINTN